MLDTYLERPAPDALLVARRGRRSEARQGAVVGDDRDRVRAAERRADSGVDRVLRRARSRRRATITSGAVTLLQEAVGTELAQLRVELDKLVAFTGGGVIDEAAVSAVVGVRPGETIGDFLDAVARRDAVAALGDAGHGDATAEVERRHDRHGTHGPDAGDRVGAVGARTRRAPGKAHTGSLLAAQGVRFGLYWTLVGRVRGDVRSRIRAVVARGHRRRARRASRGRQDVEGQPRVVRRAGARDSRPSLSAARAPAGARRNRCHAEYERRFDCSEPRYCSRSARRSARRTSPLRGARSPQRQTRSSRARGAW